MKILVNLDRCQGHAMCNMTAPAVYPLNDEGYAALAMIDVTPGNEEAARRGAASCPEGAITIEEP
jgi:ferredoxin